MKCSIIKTNFFPSDAQLKFFLFDEKKHFFNILTKITLFKLKKINFYKN